MNKKFWSGKKVFITGHTGFKGSWLCLWLQRSGAEVVGYALDPPTDPNMFEVARVAEGMKSIIGDVRDLNLLQKSIKEEEPQIVIHMAAQSVVRASYDDPVETYSTNVMGTVYVLESIRSVSETKAVVNVTTDKCYENKEWLWGYREIDALGGFDPYSNSKACSELVTASYRNSFFSDAMANRLVAVATARAGNVLGGGDWTKDQLVPDIIRSILAKKQIRIRNPYSVRPWQFVLDPLNGYLTLAEKLYEQGKDFSEAWNFGPSQQKVYTVDWIVKRILERWQGDVPIEYEKKTGPHETGYLKLDSSKSHRMLDWNSRLNIPDTIDWIVDWYRAYNKKEDMKALTLAQISRYEDILSNSPDK